MSRKRGKRERLMLSDITMMQYICDNAPGRWLRVAEEEGAEHFKDDGEQDVCQINAA